MSFAETGSDDPVEFYAEINTQKVAELITFPAIEGRDAPGKTGAAARPALVREVGLFIYPTNSPPA
jgi:hypothetical protein